MLLEEVQNREEDLGEQSGGRGLRLLWLAS